MTVRRTLRRHRVHEGWSDANGCGPSGRVVTPSRSGLQGLPHSGGCRWPGGTGLSAIAARRCRRSGWHTSRASPFMRSRALAPRAATTAFGNRSSCRCK